MYEIISIQLKNLGLLVNEIVSNFYKYTFHKSCRVLGTEIWINVVYTLISMNFYSGSSLIFVVWSSAPFYTSLVIHSLVHFLARLKNHVLLKTTWISLLFLLGWDVPARAALKKQTLFLSENLDVTNCMRLH